MNQFQKKFHWASGSVLTCITVLVWIDSHMRFSRAEPNLNNVAVIFLLDVIFAYSKKEFMKALITLPCLERMSDMDSDGFSVAVI